MTKKEKIQFVINKLEELYPNVEIPLKNKDPYTLLIAVILSAQCKDKRVNEVTPILFKRADTPLKMRKLSIRDIAEIIRPCGLHQAKSKAIHSLSKTILEKHDGKVPDTFAELEALRGVGHKTASVVMTQAFNKPAFPVDTHIHRLIHRWGLSNGKNVEQTEKDCKRLFPMNLWSKLHLQIIYFGREYCPARAHKPAECPVCSIIGRKQFA